MTMSTARNGRQSQRFTKLAGTVVLVAATAFLLAACGGSDEKAPAPAAPEPAKPAAQPEASKPAAPKPGAAKPADTAAAPEAEVVQPKTYKREIMTLPGDFPEVYPEAREQVEVYETVGSSRARRYETSDSQDDVHAYYLGAFEKSGWSVDNDAQLGDHRMIIVSKGSQKGSVMIAPGEYGGSQLIVTGVDTE